MPIKSQTHIDRALTSISVKYANEMSTYVADRVFPVVKVTQQSDRYFQYEKEDWFRDDAEERAPGTESAGGTYDIDNTPTYYCRKYAFHMDVTEEDRVNSDSPLTPDTDATEFVTDKLLLRREVAWATTYFTTGIWDTEYTGVSSGPTGLQMLQWNDPVSTPIEDITARATDMQSLTGLRPNKLVIGQYVLDALRNHPDIIDRIKYTQTGIVVMQLLAALFEVDEVLVAGAIKNSANKGQDASMGFIFGKQALLCYAPKAPTLKKASAGYIMAWTGLLGANAIGGRVRRIPMPLKGEGTERIEAEMAWDMKRISTDLGAFFISAVA